MISDPDPDLGMAVQLSSILRLLLDPENMLATSMVNVSSSVTLSDIDHDQSLTDVVSLQKSEKTDFLNFFYKRCMSVLLQPIFSRTANYEPLKEDSQKAQLLSLIIELLSFCVEHHNYHIRTCIFNKELLKHILVFMKSKHTFLVLSKFAFTATECAILTNFMSALQVLCDFYVKSSV